MEKVYLIGAGPGDEELITLKAVRALKKCTAVVYDRLAGNNILKYINEDCKVFYCGKEPGAHYKTQEEINDMLVSLAKEGNIVGRIKGGDPYVFGRGGEEALRLRHEEIPFEVIPGITSAISVLNYAGIPVTHRGKAQGFHVFTGMSAKKLEFDWKSISSLNGTLIFLMGLENIEFIVSKLIDNGKKKDTPCAVIMRGTTSKQKKLIDTLENISEKVRANGFKSPCIIAVGEVVDLNKNLTWYEDKALFGKNICVTRTKSQSKEISKKLTCLGAEVTGINSIKIKSTDENLEPYINKISEYDYIVFTSVNGVNIFFDYLKRKDFDIRKIKAKFAAIGPATEKAIKAKGIIPEFLGEQFVAESLYENMKQSIKKGDKILIPCSSDARDFLYDNFTEQGCLVDRVYIYKPILGEVLNQNSVKDIDIVLFTSPSTVRNMIKLVGIDTIREKVCISIGPITKKELMKNNIACFTSDEYTTDGMIKKILKLKEEKLI